jgi:hypothetical protein
MQSTINQGEHMTSKELDPLVRSFLNQVRGIFSSLEKLPLALEEVEKREAACDAREASQRNLDERLQAEETRLKAATEELRQKQDMRAKLKA